jgi:hypothetical protein
MKNPDNFHLTCAIQKLSGALFVAFIFRWSNPMIKKVYLAGTGLSLINFMASSS